MKKFFNSVFLPLHIPARLILLLAAGLWHSSVSYSQDYLGFANSAFAGVNGIDVNPASIVNNPRKWDVTLLGMNLGVANNYIGFQKRALKHTGKLTTGDYPAFNDDNFSGNYLTKDSKGKPVSVFAGLNLMLPSFMFTREKNDDAFAFTCRTRAYVNVDGIDPTLANIIINGKNDSSLFNQDFAGINVSAQAMLWNEYGITYGKTISQTSNERLNVGGRVKLLQGIYAMYLFINELNYKFYEADSVLIVSSLVHYGHSPNLEFNQEAVKFEFGGKPSLGLDLGASYEFHPLTEVRSRTKSRSNTTPLQHEYKYKIGFSVQDLGRIKFLKPANARDFKADLTGDLDFNSLQGTGDAPLAQADDTLSVKYPMIQEDNKFKVNLPTVASLQADYYAGKNIYVNSTFNYAFQFKNNEDKIHETTTFSVTPRWDWKWLGLYVPFSYNKYSKFRLGLSSRIGPLIVGMADILPFISKRDVYGVDFHFLLKVPHIHFGKKDNRPRGKSRYDVNREKPKHVAKKPKQTRKKTEHIFPKAKRKEQGQKHIFRRVFIFQKKNKHNARPKKRDQIIYLKM